MTIQQLAAIICAGWHDELPTVEQVQNWFYATGEGSADASLISATLATLTPSDLVQILN